MIWEPLEPGEHAWTWDDIDGESVGDDLYCSACYHVRDFNIPEEDEPPCPENPVTNAKIPPPREG